jgi:hypothetical protein
MVNKTPTRRQARARSQPCDIRSPPAKFRSGGGLTPRFVVHHQLRTE